MKHLDRDTKIQLILAKITNGKFHSSLLYKLTDIYGELDLMNNQMTTLNRPIADATRNVVPVLCVRSEILRKIIVPEELIQMLEEVIKTLL